MPFVKLSQAHQNLELFYEVHGSGKTKVLFIIGLLTDSGAWICQVRHKSFVFSSLILFLSYRLNSFENKANIK